jgi:hypothetical protein
MAGVAKYIYAATDVNHKHPLERRICYCGQEYLGRRDKPARYCSNRCSKLGDLNPMGQKVSEASPHGMTPSEYTRAHKRVYAARGKAFGCAMCNTRESRMYHWANISGRYNDVNDYVSLCVPCHDDFDRAKN